VVVTTALVPGRKAPILISEAAVAAMKPGSVIVDIAAEAGGNCALTVPDQVVTTENGVTIVGTTNLPSTMPKDASQLYSRNVYALLSPWIKDGALKVDMDDDVAKGACVAYAGDALIGGSAS
ncbi:MAG: NAD(P)(+) transhydrogenase (Re/Si-specific) subunit alpha, partial [Candidatus Eremiobacteraeota bacterium]|nr:NAD(P)(+) transhydrogenase (Re/Si-specific) subunit alpha [Candidatus Eremiobacteraeota bacterium]